MVAYGYSIARVSTAIGGGFSYQTLIAGNLIQCGEASSRICRSLLQSRHHLPLTTLQYTKRCDSGRGPSLLLRNLWRLYIAAGLLRTWALSASDFRRHGGALQYNPRLLQEVIFHIHLVAGSGAATTTMSDGETDLALFRLIVNYRHESPTRDE